MDVTPRQSPSKRYRGDEPSNQKGQTMLVYKEWTERSNGGLTLIRCQGWYLFGLIPVYVRRFYVK